MVKKIFKIIAVIYFAVFYVLSWGGVYLWISKDSEILRKDLKNNSCD